MQAPGGVVTSPRHPDPKGRQRWTRSPVQLEVYATRWLKSVSCESPRIIRAALGPRFAPCGRCLGCGNMRRSALSGAIEEEIAGHDRPSWFITLTYADEHVPKRAPKPPGVLTAVQKAFYEQATLADVNRAHRHYGRSSVHRHGQISATRSQLEQLVEARWAPTLEAMHDGYGEEMDHRPQHYNAYRVACDRQLAKLGKRRPRMMAVSEVGAKFGRPHIHMLVFGPDRDQLDVLHDTWRKGFVDLKPVTSPEIATYVAKDVFKGSFDKAAHHVKGLNPPIKVLPRGPRGGAPMPLGYQAISKVTEHITHLHKGPAHKYEEHRWFRALGHVSVINGHRYPLRNQVVQVIKDAFSGELPTTPLTEVYRQAEQEFQAALVHGQPIGEIQDLPDRLSRALQRVKRKHQRQATRWNQKTLPYGAQSDGHLLTAKRIADTSDIRPLAELRPTTTVKEDIEWLQSQES